MYRIVLILLWLPVGLAPATSPAQSSTPPLFTIARLQYNGGGDWYSDPSSLPNLLRFIKENTQIDAAEAPSEWVALKAAPSEHVLHAAALIALPAYLGRANRLIGGLYRLEALLGSRVVRIPIWMVLPGELAVGSLNLGITGVAGDA